MYRAKLQETQFVCLICPRSEPDYTVAEGGRSPPPYPSLFFKSPTSVGDYGDETPIPKIAQEGEADYEIELVVVIGKDAKDVSPEDALEYVAGYTIGNDVSARKWQKLPERAGNVPQWCFAKGFDKWAPLGPALVSPRVGFSPCVDPSGSADIAR